METVQTRAMLRGARALPSTRTVVLALAIVLFVAFCVLPVVYLFSVSITDAAGTFSLDHYRQLFTEPRRRDLLLTSGLLGGGNAIVATILGTPLGLLLARSDWPAKRLLRMALVVPLVVPPYVIALAWVLLTGPPGLLARVLGRDLFSGWTYSLTGAIVVLALGFYPLSMLATEAAARRVDGRLEEAALLIGRRRRVLYRITLPLIAPTVAAAALIIFVLALSEFGVPALLRVRVFTTEVFTAFAAFYDFGAGVALSTPLLAVALTAAVAVKLLTGERLLATRRSTHLGLRFPLGRFRPLALAILGIIVFTAVLLPLTALITEAGGVENIASAARTSGDAIANSLRLAIAGATLIVVLALLLGYGRARARISFRRFCVPVFILFLAVPGTVVGIGLLGVGNRAGVGGHISSSRWIILVAYLARFAPLAALILAASVRQIPSSSEEAAEVAGASWTRTFVRIVIPQLRTE